MFNNIFLKDYQLLPTWRNTYRDNLHPIIYPHREAIESPVANIHAPLTRVPRGRPRKERVRRDGRACIMNSYQPPSASNGQQQCSTCQQLGHKARTCRVPHL